MHVLVVDDHPLYRAGLKALLAGLDPQLTVADASRLEDAAAAAGGQPVDLVLLDMHLPGTSGMAALHAARAQFEGASVVVVSGDEDPQLMLAAVDAGASGYIPKSADPETTAQALRVVLAQGVYLPAGALRRAVQRGPAAQPGVPAMSDKQRQVLQRLLQGKPNKVIARELDIAEGTVKAHLSAVYTALNVNSRSQAMCRAYELGLLR